MNSAAAPLNRLLLPVVFVVSLAGIWALRWRFSLHEPPAVARRSLVAEGRFVSSQRGGGAVPLPQPARLLSVESGLVVWPENGDAAAVSEAFAAAWRKLAPMLELDMPGHSQRAEDENQARQLFADWWQVNSEGAVAFVSQPPGLFAARGGMYLLPLMTARDPQRAWALTGAAADMHWRTAAQAEVLKHWALQSPADVMTFAGGLPPQERRAAQTAALRAWPVEQALAWCAALPVGWRRTQHEKELARGLMQDDPGKVAALLRAGTLSGAGVASFFPDSGGHYTQQDAGRFARAAVASDPDPVGFCLWTAASKSTALQVAAWTALLEKQRVSGGSLASLAARMPEPSRILLVIAAGKAAPQESLAWAAQDPKTLDSFFTAWAEHDPAAALAAAQSLPQAGAARLTIAAASVQSAPEVAIAALRDHPDSAQAGPLLLQAARRVAYQDPGLALAALALSENTTAVEVSVALAIGGRSDPQAAADALGMYDLPVSDYVAVESFTRGWATANPEASSRWVRGLPPGELRDGGAAGLARATGGADAVGGYLWALEIGDETLRGRVLDEQKARSSQDTESLLADPRLSTQQRESLRVQLSVPPTP